MKRWLLVIGLFLSSSAFSQEDWSQAYFLLDQIDSSLSKLQNSNSAMQSLNDSISTATEGSMTSAIYLQNIVGEQQLLLEQWQNNWQTTETILKEQEHLLNSYENKLKFWRIATPTLVVLSSVITAIIVAK